jgi:hypothetical protein
LIIVHEISYELIFNPELLPCPAICIPPEPLRTRPPVFFFFIRSACVTAGSSSSGGGNGLGGGGGGLSGLGGLNIPEHIFTPHHLCLLILGSQLLIAALAGSLILFQLYLVLVSDLGTFRPKLL